jgi:hypothetical protein
LAKIIPPPDRSGVSRSWLNSMIITQVHLVLGIIKGHSNMCSCVTQHNATDVSSFEGACNWNAYCRNVHQSCCQRIECAFLYHKQPLTLFLKTWLYIQLASHLQTKYMALCGQVVCWCKHCEQSSTLWQWGYGMGRHKLQTTITIAIYQWKFQFTEKPWWNPVAHCSAIHPPPSPHVSAW